jgi:ATPase subunit of ABC transporter with duplicated ATPase domains
VNYLSVENISKSFGERTLFENISFGINKDQKIAFIAKNGSGKTTIMNIINGFDEPDTGQVVLRKSIRMAFLSQDNKLQEELTEARSSNTILSAKVETTNRLMDSTKQHFEESKNVTVEN